MARSEDEELSDVPDSWEDVVVQEEHSAGQDDSSAPKSPQSSSDKEKQADSKAQDSSPTPASTSSTPKDKSKKRRRPAREHNVDSEGEEVVEADNAHVPLEQFSARTQRAERRQWGERRQKTPTPQKKTQQNGQNSRFKRP